MGTTYWFLIEFKAHSTEENSSLVLQSCVQNSIDGELIGPYYLPKWT